MVSRVKGTQDFLDTTLFNFLITAVAAHLEKYNFDHIELPILEPTDLFKRSLGLHTDVVTKEMYVLHANKDEESICLRPEMTAPVMRAFLEHGIQTVPWKVYSWGPAFRHERPQKGRYRQFYQVTVEVIGSDSIAQDAYVISMLDRLFHEVLQLDTYTLHLNFIGNLEDRAQYRKKLEAFLDKHASALCKTCLERREKNIMRVFDCKEEGCQKLYQQAPYPVDSLSKESKLEWEKLQSYLDLLSVSFSYTPTLVRGLDYYTKSVFEFASPLLGAQSAFCGGGRYDYLATQLGNAEMVPSLGAAIGVERLMLLLEQIQDKLRLKQKPALSVILPLSDEQVPLALLLADHMHAAGLCADVLLDRPSLKSMMRKAHKMGASHVLLVGEEEQKNNDVMIKNMTTGADVRVLQRDVVTFIKG